MAKQQSSQKYIYKIHSSRLKKTKWRLDLSVKEARANDELISLADSTTLRFIKDIIGVNSDKEKSDIYDIKSKIRKIKKLRTNIENRKSIKALYTELDLLLFVKDYMCIIMDSNSDYDRCNKGFFINGSKFVRLLATTGGAKNSTIIYVTELIYNSLNTKINNGRNETKELVPGKLEAYRALSCSCSIPVSNPKGVLVVKDCVVNFKSDIIEINDTIEETPKLAFKEKADVELMDSDGYGLITPALSKAWGEELKEDYMPSGFCIRNSWTKGMLFTFDFILWAETIAHENMVEDAWGNMININEVEIILTTSMLKLWDSYTNIEHYLKCCHDNGYSYSVSKISPKVLENERNLNYQFIQSLNLDDAAIEELVTPTIKEIHEVLGDDYRKSILFLKGIHLTEDNIGVADYDYVKALTIDKRMIDDPFVKQRIHNMIKKRINEAKVGVLKVRGNFSIVSGDPVSLLQSMFNITVTGLLKAGEFYSSYWYERGVDKVACFRAPMTCHNNVRLLNIKSDGNMEKWYKYMKQVTIFNSWDTTAHALNGLDKDADSVLTTDCKQVISGIEELPAILCVQKASKKEIVTEEMLILANKNSFGDEIGSITNRITSMFTLRAKFEKGSKEYDTLDYRICCGQNFQQNAIDKVKGIISKPMSKEWYDYKINMKDDKDSLEDKERKQLNLSILAEKKSYFMNYIYPDQMKSYNNFTKKSNNNCLRRFGITVAEMQTKTILTKDERTFLKYYNIKMPVETYPSIMNKICKRIELEFDDCDLIKPDDPTFDYSILMTTTPVSQVRYNDIKKLYKDYNKEISQYAQTIKKERVDKEEKTAKREIFKNNFKTAALEICNNQEELCNIVVSICYKTNSSKQFAWDIAGETIIQNLLDKNDNTIKYPTLNDLGDIKFGGYAFSMESKSLRGR